jgi:predicted AlkP superfamily pyrophosphatase or phosphodiesterase
MRSILKRSTILALWCLVVLAPAFCRASSKKTKLIVIVTVDQFRADYLERYDKAFEGGFRRLRDNGLRYDKAIVDHAPTLSWPGHTTIATGAYPKTHGIATDAFIKDERRQMMLQDDEEQILGFPGSLSLSSRNIQVTGIADWIRASDPSARTVALSTGPGLALCYGGRPRSDRSLNHVYWLDSYAGQFITTTYYRDEYPDWVKRFNGEVLPAYKESLAWANSVPEEYQYLARRDDAPYEGDGIHTSFPHRIEHSYPDTSERSVNSWFCNYSFGAEQALFSLAKVAIENLQLGMRGATDLLTIAVKITDRIGHDFGPLSLEQMDIVLRIDRELGEFLDFLDANIGKGAYLFVLTADHGAPNIVEYELEQGRYARRVSEEDIRKVLEGVEELIIAYDGPEDELPSLIAGELEKADFIAKAMTPQDLAGTGTADHILESYRTSYVPGIKSLIPLWTNDILRGNISPNHPGNFGVIVEFVESAQLYTASSAHLSSYKYDQEVPIIFIGHGIKAGIGKEYARTIDIAPTLARLAGIPFPGTVDGKILAME